MENKVNPPEKLVKNEESLEQGNINDNDANILDTADNDGDFIDQAVYDNLPKLLRESSAIFKNKHERDVYLIGALTVLGGAFHNLYAYNDEDKKIISPNLLAFIVAPPASGKGVLRYSRKLLEEIRKIFSTNSKTLGSKTTGKLILPANSSTSGLVQLLQQNNGVGIMIESEIDTLINANKQDWGNYSDILRNAFENENASLYRKTEKEHIELENLKMALAISGTPGQFKTLMMSVENGLFSRGWYYVFDNPSIQLKCYGRMKTELGKDLNAQFADFAKIASDYYNQHLTFDKVQVVFSAQQLEEIQTALQTEYNRISSVEELRANIYRSFIISLKVATILTFLEACENGNLNDSINCSNAGLITAISLMLTNLRHSYKAYELLPKRNKSSLSVNQQRLYVELPSEFERSEAIKISKTLSIGVRTMDGYLKVFKEKQLIESTSKMRYKKKE